MSTLLNLIQTIPSIILGLFGIGFIIGFHELGHFLFCKLFGIKTPSFSIGMGPKIYSRKIGETEFVFSALPVGGYVEIAGAQEIGQGEQKDAKSTDQSSFAKKPYYQKMLVMGGGILFNIIFGYVVLSSLFYVGMPKFPMIYPNFAQSTIKIIGEKTPAATSGLQPGDTIIAYDGTPTNNNALALIKWVQKHPGQTVRLTIKRNNTEKTIKTVIGTREIKNQEKQGFIGVDFKTQYPFFTAIKKGVEATHFLIGQVVASLKKLFVTRDTSQIAGPIMLTTLTVKSASLGLKIFLLFLAIISINLAVFNVIPLPIMDGGQALFYTVEAITGRPLSEKTRYAIHLATWILVLFLFIFLGYKDIVRIWKTYFSK